MRIVQQQPPQFLQNAHCNRRKNGRIMFDRFFAPFFFLLLSPGSQPQSRNFKGNEWAARIQAFHLQTMASRFFSDKTRGYKMARGKEKRLSLYWPKWRGLRMDRRRPGSKRLTTLSAVVLSLILILTNALAALLLPLKIKMLILKV